MYTCIRVHVVITYFFDHSYSKYIWSSGNIFETHEIRGKIYFILLVKSIRVESVRKIFQRIYTLCQYFLYSKRTAPKRLRLRNDSLFHLLVHRLLENGVNCDSCVSLKRWISCILRCRHDAHVLYIFRPRRHGPFDTYCKPDAGKCCTRHPFRWVTGETKCAKAYIIFQSPLKHTNARTHTALEKYI